MNELYNDITVNASIVTETMKYCLHNKSDMPICTVNGCIKGV